MSSAIIWSQDRIDFLKKNYGIMRDEDVASALGLSCVSVRCMATKIGLRITATTRAKREKTTQKKKNQPGWNTQTLFFKECNPVNVARCIIAKER